MKLVACALCEQKIAAARVVHQIVRAQAGAQRVDTLAHLDDRGQLGGAARAPGGSQARFEHAQAVVAELDAVAIDGQVVRVKSPGQRQDRRHAAA